MPTLILPTDHAGKPIVNLYVGAGLAKSESLREQGISIPVARPLRALVDTGASRTVVEGEHLKDLGLLPIAEEDVHTASSGANPVIFHVYAIELSLAESVTRILAKDLPVLGAADLRGLGVQMLLGRDVLGRVILTYNGPARQFRMEFDEDQDGA